MFCSVKITIIRLKNEGDSMKIQAIQGQSSTSKNHFKRNDNNSPQNSVNNKAPSFGAGGFGKIPEARPYVKTFHWNIEKLNILNRTKEEMIDLAEYFHLKKDYELEVDDYKIYEITKDGFAYIAGCLKDFGQIFKKIDNAHYDNTLKKQETETAKRKFNEAMATVKGKKLKMVKIIEELEPKKALGLGNEVEQKDRLNRDFVLRLVAEQEGKSIPITNGILVHGSSKEKEGFIKWLLDSTGAVIKRFKHDTKNPMKTIENIVDTAESAEKAFQHSNTRTILVVDDLDKMLTTHGDLKSRKLIARFKGFVEHLSKEYHTTLVTKTSKSLDTFEEASIGPNRFGIKVNLKDGISKDELKTLNEYKAEIKRLDDKASDIDTIQKTFMDLY